MTTDPTRDLCTVCHAKPSRNRHGGPCEACYRRELRANPRPRPEKKKKRTRSRSVTPTPEKITPLPSSAPPQPSTCPLTGTPSGVSDKPGKVSDNITPSDIIGVEDMGTHIEWHQRGPLEQVCYQALDGIEAPPWKIKLALFTANELDLVAEDPERTAPASLIVQLRDLMRELTQTETDEADSGNRFTELLAQFRASR